MLIFVNYRYISATSSGRDASLDQTSGGRCSTHNMRIKIYVCVDANGKTPSPTEKSSKVPFKHHVNSAFWLSSFYRTLTVTSIRTRSQQAIVTLVFHIVIVLSRNCHAIIFREFTPVVVFDIFFVADPKCNTSPVSATAHAQPTKTVTVCPTPTQTVHVSATTVTQRPYCSGKSHLVHHDSRNTGGRCDKINSCKVGYCDQNFTFLLSSAF